MYISFYTYLIAWKLVGDLKFHDVLQTTIIRQITKDNGEIGKIEKYSQKNVKIVYNCVAGWGYICVLLCVDVSVCMKIHAPLDEFEVVSWMYETRCVAEFATDWPRKKLYIYIYICMYKWIVCS